MPKGIFFWVLMILWFLSWLGTRWGPIYDLRICQRFAVLPSLLPARLARIRLRHLLMTRDHFGRRPVAYRRGMALLMVIVAVMIIAWVLTRTSGNLLPR